MSKTANNAIQQNKNFILMAVFGFGGMLTAILASIAVVTPLVNAQVNGALALQTARTAQTSSIQTQPVASVMPANTPANACVTPDAQSDAHQAVATPKGGIGGGTWEAPAFKAAWIKTSSPSLAGATNSGNTNITNNTTNTTTNTANIDSHDTHTVTKTKVNLSVSDSFNTTNTTTDVNISDNNVGNTTTTDSNNDTNISDNNVGNTSTTDVNISDNNVGNTTTTDSNNQLLSNNDVTITPTI